MSAGNKTELITFERETDTRRPGGGQDAVWSQIGQAWARVEWIGGSEGERAGAVRATSRYRFTVYGAAVDALTLTPADRILWNGDRYNIRERPRTQMGNPDVAIIAEGGVTQ